MKSILIVDDERPLILSLKDGLEAYYADQLSVLIAASGEEAVEIVRSTAVDLLVTDLKMPGMNGLELLEYMKNHFPTVPCIVMTAFNTPEIELKLRKLGPFQAIEKPIGFGELVQSISEILNLKGRGP
ncbi:MAG: response regulator [Desulfobacterales bacterium]|nr:response regulator [Desulfobacterales bacterium]